jgi:hypothetical protein
MSTTDKPLGDRVSALSDAEQAYLARWITAVHPQIAEEALTALARYRREDPDTARLMIGPETGRLANDGEAAPCGVCGHNRTDHLTRAPSRPEPYFCALCGCRQYREAVTP